TRAEAASRASRVHSAWHRWSHSRAWTSKNQVHCAPMRTTISHVLALTLALAFGFATTACDKKEDKKDDKKSEEKKGDEKSDDKEAKAGGEEKKEGDGGW